MTSLRKWDCVPEVHAAGWWGEGEEEEDRMGRFTYDVRNLMCNYETYKYACRTHSALCGFRNV
jgi:hypothetical protein